MYPRDPSLRLKSGSGQDEAMFFLVIGVRCLTGGRLC